MIDAVPTLRYIAVILARARVDFLTDYEIKALAPEIVGEDIPFGVIEFINRIADEIEMDERDYTWLQP